MTNELFVVAYEGGNDDSNVLAYAIAQAKKVNASLHIVHILEWSPYKFLTPEEIEERHNRRKQEMARAQSAVLDPAIAKAKSEGVEAKGEMRYGNVVDLIAAIAKESGASLILVGRSGSNSVAARIFGSVPMGLAQVATVPTVIVP